MLIGVKDVCETHLSMYFVGHDLHPEAGSSVQKDFGHDQSLASILRIWPVFVPSSPARGWKSHILISIKLPKTFQTGPKTLSFAIEPVNCRS